MLGAFFVVVQTAHGQFIIVTNIDATLTRQLLKVFSISFLKSIQNIIIIRDYLIEYFMKLT